MNVLQTVLKLISAPPSTRVPFATHPRSNDLRRKTRAPRATRRSSCETRPVGPTRQTK